MVSQKEKADALLIEKKFEDLSYRTLRQMEELVLSERVKLLAKLTKLNQQLTENYNKTLHPEQETLEAKPSAIEMLHDGAMSQKSYSERLNYLRCHLEALRGLIEETEELKSTAEELGWEEVGVA